MKINLLPVKFSIVFCLLSVVSPSAQCAELARVGTYLEVIGQLTKLQLQGDTINYYTAEREFKFKIVNIDDKGICFVEFVKVGKGSKVEEGRIYTIAKTEIHEGTCRFTRRFYAAALSVPFKYRPKLSGAPSALSTNFDIGGALGYSFRGCDVTWTPLAFMGLATISLSDANSKEIET